MVDAVYDTAGPKQHAAKDELLDGVRVRAGGVKDGNAQLCHAGDGNIIGASSASSDRSDTNVDLGLLEFVRT